LTSYSRIEKCGSSGAVFPINGRLRDELLTETLFTTLVQARSALDAWRADDNSSRPHSKLNWLSPSAFGRNFHEHTTNQNVKQNRQSELQTGQLLGQRQSNISPIQWVHVIRPNPTVASSGYTRLVSPDLTGDTNLV
jgi:hypothetical protein